VRRTVAFSGQTLIRFRVTRYKRLFSYARHVGVSVSVEFRLLGDIQVYVNGEQAEVGHARQRCVLATLLVDANKVVPGTQLVDRIWGDHRMPARPANALQTYLALLRRVLAGSGEVAIEWRAPGYRLAVEPSRVDLFRFRDLITDARGSADDERVAALLEQALRLWRGEPFGTLDNSWLNTVRATLVKQHHVARLDLTDILLRRARHAALVPELYDQLTEHPFDERLAGQLMLALYRSGRTCDALEVYQQIRRRLAEELGTDPGLPLRTLHRQVLAADPVLDRTAGSVTVGSAQSVVPRQLPAPPRLFVGRSPQLRLLDDALLGTAVMGVAAITGTGGVGKSWLAVHWAHTHAGEFPDGQLFVNLRGYDPAGEPLSPDTAVRGFLAALGVADPAMPSAPDARTALYRTLMAGKRILVVLDNARDSRQVEDLLPGSPTCAVLVSSRRWLGGLVGAHGAHPVELDVLTEREAGALLVGHLGHDRTAAEPDATAELLATCAGLPLALAIVAVRAAQHARLSLAVLAEELRVSAARLDALDGGDLNVNLRAVLSWSHDALEAEHGQLLALLGLAPGPDIGVDAVASLVGRPVAATRVLLRQLENAHLVQQHLPGRYRMHDLVRLYAAERATADLPAESRTAALGRVIDFYLRTAVAGEVVLNPHRDPITLAAPTPGCRPAPPLDQAEAMRWFDAEHPCLLAAQQVAADQGWHTVVWQLPWALSTFHRRRGYFHHQHSSWLVGLAAAERSDASAAQVVAHRRLALACTRIGRHSAAVEHLDRAIDLAERSGDLRGLAHSHQAFAVVWEMAGDDQAALDHLGHALRLFRAVGTPAQAAEARNGIGWHLGRLGRYQDARTQCELALATLREHNYADAVANTLDSLRFVSYEQGDFDTALDYGHQALAAYRTLGHTFEEANALDHLAAAHLAAHEPDAARRCWQQAYELYQAQNRFPDADRVRRRLAGMAAASGARGETEPLRIGTLEGGHGPGVAGR
jgi:DNA-binding SARP family transcriptional activator/tetratricopeptide (TPR) repeat protein